LEIPTEVVVRLSRHWQVFLVVTAGAFLANLDLFIVNIAFPSIQADFPAAGLSTLSWTLNGYAIVFAALLVPAGRLADRVGRRRVYLLGLGLFVLASALCALAWGPWPLIGFRLLQAVGAALVIPTSLGLLLDEFPPERRSAAVGLWTAGVALAATLGPTIGGLLVTQSWRWVFLVNVPLGVIAIVAGSRILRESRRPAGGRLPDLAGAAALALGVGALALAIVEGDAWGWTSPGILAALAVAAASLGAFAWRSGHHPAPVVEPWLVRSRVVRVANLSVFLYSAAFYPLLLLTVLFMTDIWHYSVLQTGLALSPGPLMVALLSAPIGARAGRDGAQRLVLIGITLFVAGCLWWLWRSGSSPSYLTTMLPALVVTGAGVAFTFPVLAGAAVSGLPPERTATGSALFNMSRQMGGVIGVAVVVAILGSDGAPALADFRAGWAFMAAVVVASGVAAAFLPRTRRLPSSPEVTRDDEHDPRGAAARLPG
jgi:EmrB/QacA subfamily drug resistance transporter